MFDTLTGRLDGIFKKLRARGKLHPKQVDAALAEMRVALLEATSPPRSPTTCSPESANARCPRRS